MTPTFIEFFAGGGMARAGLSPDWTCLFANDIDPKKGAAYVANWGPDEFRSGDISALKSSDIPDADLAWASFPCQDLSVAGYGRGLAGERSGLFWSLWSLLNGKTRKPTLLVLENVGGTLTSKGGDDFREICRALASLGYSFGAVMADAVHFVPQSRPRMFMIAVRDGHGARSSLSTERPSNTWAPAALRKLHGGLSADLRARWIWWKLPEPPARNVGVADLIVDEPQDVDWHSQEETARLIAMMSAVNLEKVKIAKASGLRCVGTVYRRTRIEDGIKHQRAEVRFDDVAGCLRTPAGGSSRQIVMVVEGGEVRTRLLSKFEAASLMGLTNYSLPERYNDAYHLLGDGLAVPVVRFLSDHILRPLVSDRKNDLAA
jgi:DNA (cytosine-5)-methyltransferase 1